MLVESWICSWVYELASNEYMMGCQLGFQGLRHEKLKDADLHARNDGWVLFSPFIHTIGVIGIADRCDSKVDLYIAQESPRTIEQINADTT